MPRRLTNLLLLTLAFGLAGSGLVGWISPDGTAGLWYEVHRLLGVIFVLTLFWKAPIVRGSLARRLEPVMNFALHRTVAHRGPTR